MVITRTPLRIPIAGGGTDFPTWIDRHGSMFISAAINKFIYITYHRSLFDKKIRVRYSEMESVDNVDDVKNAIVRETLKQHSIKDSVEITSHADIPSGSGLGSSGSFGVGVLNAISHGTLSKIELAMLASQIQIDRCNFPIGYQDQYVAAFGGINVYRTNTRDKGYFRVRKLIFDHEKLEERLVLFHTGITRDANKVLAKSKKHGLDKIQKLAEETLDAFKNDDFDRYGDILNRHWLYKKERGGMTNEKIDELYNLGIDNGAIGGKLIGAGGGGFLMFYTKHPKRLIDNMPLQHVPFRFYFNGSTFVEE